MAIKVLKKGSGHGKCCVMEFLCDTEEDVANLPTQNSTGAVGKFCAAGSMALIADGHAMKVLNNQGEWK